MTFPIIDKKKSFLIILVLPILDQFSKVLALKYFPTICNSGSAFGLQVSLFVTIIVFVSVGFLYIKNKTDFNNLGYVLILSGGLSNLLDRVTRGCVVDFINLKFWPSFNLADSAITIGALILIVNTLKTKKNEA